jgi:hypothetical protein
MNPITVRPIAGRQKLGNIHPIGPHQEVLTMSGDFSEIGEIYADIV